MSIVAGTRAPIEAVKYFREAAKPKQVFPPDPPMRQPSTSVAMLRRRARAELAQQGGFPPTETNVDANLLEQREGELIARRRANQRVNFEAYDAHKANIEALLSAQHGYSAQKDVLQYLAEHAQVEHTLGTAHAELRPHRRQDIADRIAQIRELIASSSQEAQVAGGRAMAQRYRFGRDVGRRGRRPNPRAAFDTGYQPARA